MALTANFNPSLPCWMQKTPKRYVEMVENLIFTERFLNETIMILYFLKKKNL